MSCIDQENQDWEKKKKHETQIVTHFVIFDELCIFDGHEQKLFIKNIG